MMLVLVQITVTTILDYDFAYLLFSFVSQTSSPISVIELINYFQIKKNEGIKKFQVQEKQHIKQNEIFLLLQKLPKTIKVHIFV